MRREGGREEENGEKKSDVDGRSRKNGKYLRDRKRRGKKGKVVMGGEEVEGLYSSEFSVIAKPNVQTSKTGRKT